MQRQQLFEDIQQDTEGLHQTACAATCFTPIPLMQDSAIYQRSLHDSRNILDALFNHVPQLN